MTTSRYQATEARVVSLESAMYIVRFNAMPALGGGAILSIAPSDSGVKIDFFEVME